MPSLDPYGHDAYCPGCGQPFAAFMIGTICSYCRTGRYGRERVIRAGKQPKGIAAREVDGEQGEE